MHDLLKERKPSTPRARSRCSRSSSRRSRRLRVILAILLGTTALGPQAGCSLARLIPAGPHDTNVSYHANDALRIEYPEVAQCETPAAQAAARTIDPLALQDPAKLPATELALDQAVQQALRESPVLRSLGGTIFNPFQGSRTIYDPALAHANPQFGVEAALSAFDAQYNQSLFWNTIDQPTNVAPGGFTALFTPGINEGTQASFFGELSKRTATGTQFSLRHIVDYDRNNRPRSTRLFSTVFTGAFEAEMRHPLGQGAGTTFNRIAGPTTIPGQYNGVLIARVNENVELADFEAAVIQLVADVEQAYWDLWTAYRVLEAGVKGREAALQTFQYQQVRLEVGTGRLDEEAQARSQFYQFEIQVQSALGGTNGLYTAEQRLRYLIGLPATDGSLIRPVTSPNDTKVVFDWDSALGQALNRRVEVRRQRFNVKRREMELVAARLNRRPRLDLVSAYRWRGLGDNLIGPTDNGIFDNLYDSISDGDYQDWRAGVELNFPVGLRAASNAIAHARLNLNREVSLLSETELRVSHDLSEAARQVSITHALLETNYNRYLADLRQVDVLRRRYLDGADNINFLLQAQRQVVISETEFYQSLSNYNLAIRDFHRQKGSLLAYNHVQLAEGPWAAGAAPDAYEKGRFLTPRHAPERVSVPQPLTSGPFDPASVQRTSDASLGLEELDTPPPDEFPESAGVPVGPAPLVVSGPEQRSFELIESPGTPVVLEAPAAD